MSPSSRSPFLADDLVALLDHLEIERAVIGGISLGSAVAVNMALRYPERVLGLVLSRPAWIDRPLPENVQLYTTIAELLRELGAKEGLERFRRTASFRRWSANRRTAPSRWWASSSSREPRNVLPGWHGSSSIPPALTGRCIETIKVPTLVLGNHQDPIHPWDLAETLAGLIPGAELCEITPKSVSLEQHAADVQKAIDGFCRASFLQCEVDSHSSALEMSKVMPC